MLMQQLSIEFIKYVAKRRNELEIYIYIYIYIYVCVCSFIIDIYLNQKGYSYYFPHKDMRFVM